MSETELAVARALALATAPSFTDESLSPTSTPMALRTHVLPPAIVSESRLLRLPLELRYMIYDYTLAVSIPPTPLTDSYSQLSYDGHVDTSILLVCRQIYAEARSICFKINTLTFPAGHAFDVFLDKLASWQRDEIRSVGLRFARLRLDELGDLTFKGWSGQRISPDIEIISPTTMSLDRYSAKIVRLENVKRVVFEADSQGSEENMTRIRETLEIYGVWLQAKFGLMRMRLRASRKKKD